MQLWFNGTQTFHFRMTQVKLLGEELSPFCCRVEWALKLKGVTYEYIDQDLKNKSPLLLESNPVHKKVPVLLHNGKPVCESLVIVEYIDEAWEGHSLLPKDPYERALARFWANLIDQKLVSNAWTVGNKKGEEKEKAVKSVEETLGILNKEIEGKKYFGGETIGLVDLVLGSLPNWINFIEETGGIKLLDAEKFPELDDWFHRFTADPIYQGRVPTKEGLIDYFKNH